MSRSASAGAAGEAVEASQRLPVHFRAHVLAGGARGQRAQRYVLLYEKGRGSHPILMGSSLRVEPSRPPDVSACMSSLCGSVPIVGATTKRVKNSVRNCLAVVFLAPRMCVIFCQNCALDVKKSGLKHRAGCLHVSLGSFQATSFSGTTRSACDT